jgi:arylsulfatase A-like enzyme
MTSLGSARLLALAVAVVVLLAAYAAVPAKADAEPPASAERSVARPNIVLITTDDQTLAELRWMPQTRRLLGDAGVRFTDFLANHPLCCPSRAQILTGQYAQNNHVLTNGPRWGGYDRFEPATALPVWLQNAGYTTGLVGKYLNLYDETDGPEVGWDRWNPTVDGLYTYVGFTQYDGAALTTPGGHQTDHVSDWSADFIAQQAPAAEPFFLWSSYVAPHSVCYSGQERLCSEPPVPEDEDAHRFSQVWPPFLDDPAYDRGTRKRERPTLDGQGRPDLVEQVELFRARLRSLAGVDRAVARTVGALSAVGVLDETVVIFTSDNGYLFGEHRFSGKDVPFDEALRVPLLVRGPDVSPGAVATTPAAGVDLAPTIAELAGATPMVAVDGRSLVPAFAGGRTARDRTVLVQGGVTGPDELNRVWAYRGVRTKRYTYVRYTRNGGIELYDRRRDPHELVNVARDPAYRKVRRELLRRLRLLGPCAGASCNRAFGPVPGPVRKPRR